MTALKDQQCEACRAGAPKATAAETAEWLPQIPDWRLIDVNGVQRLQRQFKFRNFVDALAFTQRVGELAEQNAHHPAILTEWGSVTVSWWTHKIHGLHRNDFLMAAKTDSLI